MKEYRDAGADHSARNSPANLATRHDGPERTSGQTRIRRRKRREEPPLTTEVLGIGGENSNPGHQVSRRVFQSCVETSPDHFLSGRPGSDRKPDDTRPCDDPHRDVRNFHHPSAFIGMTLERALVWQGSCESLCSAREHLLRVPNQIIWNKRNETPASF